MGDIILAFGNKGENIVAETEIAICCQHFCPVKVFRKKVGQVVMSCTCSHSILLHR